MLELCIDLATHGWSCIPVTIKTSDFEIETPLFTFNYLVDIFVENVDLSQSKFERVVFEL